MILLVVETLARKQNHADSADRKPFFTDDSLDRKQQIADSLDESQISRTVSEAVYILIPIRY